MKKITILFSILFVAVVLTLAQTPQIFNYQAVARDQFGHLMTSKALTVRIGILQDESLIWQEDHNVTTNSIGSFSLSIGDPLASNTLGSVSSFSDIPWGAGHFQLQVSVDAGSGFNDLGTSEFQSVPFALYAARGPGGSGGENTDNQVLSLTGNTLSISGGNSVDLSFMTGGGSEWDSQNDTLSTMNHVGIGTSNPYKSTLAVQGKNLHPESPLFEVRREDGFPVFAVYNDGVMVFVDEEAKGIKGGFAVGGYNRTAKGVSQEYLRVTPDSVRVYIPDASTTKGVKGGFAVGGYNRTAKGLARDFLYVTADSTRIYVPKKGNEPGVEGLTGGFAVSTFSAEGSLGGANEYLMGINRGITRFNTSDRDRGFAIGSQEDGWGSSYMELTPTNSFLGFDAGLSNNTIDPDDEWGMGTMNVFVGYQSGMENETGHHNTFVGFCAGTNTIGGDMDSPEHGSENVFIGSQAGFNNTKGNNNVYMGFHAGISSEEGRRNVFIGDEAGANALNLESTVLIGPLAGTDLEGNFNTYIGDHAGLLARNGQHNVALGRYAGQNGGGSRNTMVGNNAGGGNSTDATFSDNTLIGYKSGQSLTSGINNVYLGANAGQATTTGGGNTFLGFNSGFSYLSGYSNTFVGSNSGFNTTTGQDNIFLGTFSGYSNTIGSDNVVIGYTAGYNNVTGAGNVFIGDEAGYNETGSNTLYISNSQTSFPLIYGEFQGYYLEFNADVQVAGTIVQASDRSLKDQIEPVTNSLDKIRQINGVSFVWKEEAMRKGTTSSSSIGFIAQEVEGVFPSLVHEDRKGIKAVNYSGMVPVLLEAIKEQQAQIEALEQRLAELEK